MNPFPFPPNEGPEFYRGQRIDQALDVSADETLERWTRQPEWDTRSLEEFAAEGGRPMFPPNRVVREGFDVRELLVSIGRAFLKVADFYRCLFKPRRDDRGRFYELPPAVPRFVPAPPPPSTGYLRSSLSENERRAGVTIVGGPR